MSRREPDANEKTSAKAKCFGVVPTGMMFDGFVSEIKMK